MAAEKPIVSTAVNDVVSLYGDSVSIVTTPGELVSACASALAETDVQRKARVQRMRTHVTELTWNRTARAIHAEIESVLRNPGSMPVEAQNRPRVSNAPVVREGLLQAG